MPRIELASFHGVASLIIVLLDSPLPKSSVWLDAASYTAEEITMPLNNSPPLEMLSPNDARMAKYERMVKAGLPQGAVENGMIRDKIDPGSLFDNLLTDPDRKVERNLPVQTKHRKKGQRSASHVSKQNKGGTRKVHGSKRKVRRNPTNSSGDANVGNFEKQESKLSRQGSRRQKKRTNSKTRRRGSKDDGPAERPLQRSGSKSKNQSTRRVHHKKEGSTRLKKDVTPKMRKEKSTRRQNSKSNLKAYPTHREHKEPRERGSKLKRGVKPVYKPEI